MRVRAMQCSRVARFVPVAHATSTPRRVRGPYHPAE
jgi:hypothetical protein